MCLAFVIENYQGGRDSLQKRRLNLFWYVRYFKSYKKRLAYPQLNQMLLEPMSGRFDMQE